jgi:hypothetical protein
MKPIDWDKLSDDQWNRLAAEKVMGWHEQNGLWYDGQHPVFLVFDGPTVMWSPLTRWDHAGMLLEEIAVEFPVIQIHHYPNNNWIVRVAPDGWTYETLHEAGSEYGPSAITKACVRAVMEEE